MQADEQAEVDTREEQKTEDPGNTTVREERGKPNDKVKDDDPQPEMKEDPGSEYNDANSSDLLIEAKEKSICSGISQHASPDAIPSSPAGPDALISLKGPVKGDEEDEPLVSYFTHLNIKVRFLNLSLI